MKRFEVETLSRVIPYTPAELAWLRDRPAADRVPVPGVGAEVGARLDHWGEVYPATVESVQPSDDIEDQHLYQVALDAAGEVLLIEGQPVLSSVPDPWPTLWLVIEMAGKLAPVHSHMREARLRGSPGWLPLDWKTRRRPLPAALVPLITEGD